MSIIGNAIMIGGGSADLITKNITANGTYSATDDGYDGYSDVTVNVSGASTLVSKTITANGVYDPADDSADRYSSVTVDVLGGVITPTLQDVTYGFAYKKTFQTTSVQKYYNNVYELPAGTYLFCLSNTTTNLFRGTFFEGKNYSDFSEYMASEGTHGEAIYSDGTQLTPDPTGGNETWYNQRFIFTAESSGVLLVTTSSSSAIAPTLCFDIGT